VSGGSCGRFSAAVRGAVAKDPFDSARKFFDLFLSQGGLEAMGPDPGDGDDPAALRARLDRLSGQLKGRAAPPSVPEPKRETKPDNAGSAMSLGLRAGSEFVSAVIIGLGIGWVLDRALGTNPAFLIVFFMLGVAAAVWNVIRLTSPKAGSFDRNSPLSRTDSADKDVRRSASGAERDASLGGRGAAGVADDDEE
jgi:ATP synthase protein I